MAKPRIESYRFDVPLYKAHVLLVRSTPAAYFKLIKGYCTNATEATHLPRGDGEASLLTATQAPPLLVIWLDARAVLSDPYWVGVLAHECWHAVWRFAREIGLARTIDTEPSGEAHAYLHGWLVQHCMKRLQRRSRRPRRAGARKR